MRNESSYDLANHINKMAVSTALAGVRQRNLFGIYMENFSTYRDAISEAEKAEGTAARKMQAYNESVAYSINQLSAAWEGFTQKLEASPAVKLYFNGLTAIIKNLDHILQHLIPVIATFNADKIASLAKFFSPLITTPFKAIRHPTKSKGTFYENMTQKMTAENTNAIEELTDAIKDNTAAQRGEKTKSGKGGTNKGDTRDKSEAKEARPGSIQDLQNQIDADEQSIKDLIDSGKDENSQEVQALRAKQAEKQKQILKKQERSARLKTGAAAGLAAGAVRFANKGSSFVDDVGMFKGTGDVEVSTGEAAAMGGMQAVLTGALTAWLGPFGTVIASVGGDFLSSLWKKFAHADEIDRKQRVEDAKKQLEAIKGVSASVTGLIDIRKKGESNLWDADDWKQANEYVESINKAAKASEAFSKAIGKTTIDLANLTEVDLANIEAARIRFEAEQTYIAGEQDRYNLMKEISENQKKLNDKDISVREQARAAIVSATASLEEYSDALQKSYLEEAFYSSGVSSMKTVDIANATIDRIIAELAREWSAKGGSNVFTEGGTITSSARSSLMSFIRQQSGFESLFNNRTKDVYEIRSSLNLFGGNEETIKELKELSQKQSLDGLVKKLNELGVSVAIKDTEALANIIDKINTADVSSISTIAHGLNMTVEQFEEANKNGAFDWLTTGDILEGSDKFLEKMTSLSGIFADLSKNASLSAENIQKVLKNYKFLLRGSDGTMSADNIVKNLGDIFLNGVESQISRAYIGMKSSEIMENRDIWSAIVSDESFVKMFEDVADQKELKAAKTYKDVIPLMEGNARAKEKFWEMASGIVGEMSLFKEMREILIEYQTNAYDTEISNLQSIKDSLGDVNKQREKELELIKAKEALENASKEKKRVYRAGIGFVYETDQEAVKAAQEKVDELERQKTQEDIQYQIDILEQQKSILENVAKNEELQELKGKIEEFFGKNNMGQLISAIFSINDPELQKKLKGEIEYVGKENSSNANEEKNKTEAKDAIGAFNEAVEKYQEEFLGKNEVKPGNVVYKDYMQRRKTAYDNLLKLQSGANKKAEEAGMAGVSLNTTNSDMGSYIGAEPKTDNLFGLRQAKIFMNRLSGSAFLDISENMVSQKDFDSSFNKQISGAKALKFKEKNGVYFLSETLNSIPSFSDLERVLDNGEILIYDSPDNQKDYGVYKKGGKIYSLGLEGGSGHIGSYYIPEDYGGEDYYSNKKRSDELVIPLVPDLFGAGSGKYLIIDENGHMRIDNSYSSGTLSASGGRSLINENGLESIITPQGTVTSLPAKSGIVPADLTRNLWTLGEVAPNLIARLTGSSLQTTANSTTNDNSIKVQNLNATFNTKNDFDGRQFWSDVRSQIVLSKN